MNRADLETKLREQRERRLAVGKSSLGLRQRKRMSSVLVLVGVIVVSVGLFILFMYLSSRTAILDFPVEPTFQDDSPAQTAPTNLAASPSLIPTPVMMIVCTHVSNGRMNVHFEPGPGKDVRGYLKEGETVIIVETTDVNGRMWFRLSSPVIGWANSRYLCESD